MSKLRIVLADDHAVVREGLKSLINAQPDMVVVGEAHDGVEALAQVAEQQPDLLLVDISMPGHTGSEVATQVHKTWPAIHILALSVHEETAYVQRLLEAGAAGYVLKRSAADKLIIAVRSISTGGTYIDPLVAGGLVNTITGRNVLFSRNGHLPLSERESDVLRMIAQGYSNKEVAFNLSISAKTVETYTARAMEKLGLASRVDIVRYAMGRAWLS